MNLESLNELGKFKWTLKVFTEVGKGDSDEGDIMMFVTYSLLVNPEKLTQKFSEISVFWGVTLRKLKTHPVFFSKFQFPGYKLDWFFWKLIHQFFVSSYSVFVKYRGMS